MELDEASAHDTLAMSGMSGMDVVDKGLRSKKHRKRQRKVSKRSSLSEEWAEMPSPDILTETAAKHANTALARKKSAKGLRANSITGMHSQRTTTGKGKRPKSPNSMIQSSSNGHVPQQYPKAEHKDKVKAAERRLSAKSPQIRRESAPESDAKNRQLPSGYAG